MPKCITEEEPFNGVLTQEEQDALIREYIDVWLHTDRPEQSAIYFQGVLDCVFLLEELGCLKNKKEDYVAWDEMIQLFRSSLEQCQNIAQ